MSAPSRRRPSRRFCGFDLLESRAVPAVVFSPAVTAEVQADAQDFAAGGVPNFLLDQYRVVGNHGTLHLVTSGGGSTFDQQYSNTITRVGGAAAGGFSASDSVDFFLQELSARSADPANGDGSDFSSAGIHIQTESYTTSGNVTAFDLVYTVGGYRFDQHFLMQTTPDSSGGSYATGDAINTFISDLDAHRNEFLNWKYPTPSGAAGSVGNGTATGTTTGTGATGSATASVTHYSRASHVKPGTSLGTNGLTTIGNTSGAGAGTSIIGTQGTTTTGAGIGTGVNGTGVGNAGTGSGTGLLGSGTGTNTGSGTGTGITGTGTPTSGIGTTGTGTGTNIGPGTTGTGLGTGTIGTGTGTGIGSGITGTGSGIGTGTTSTGTGIGTGTTGTGVGTGITGLGSTMSPTASYDLGSSVPGTQDSGIASPSAGPISNLVSPGTPLVNPGPAITTDNGNTIGA